MSIINLRNHIADSCKNRNCIEDKISEIENKLKTIYDNSEFVKKSQLNEEINNLIEDLKSCFDDVLLATPRNSSDIDILKQKINEFEGIKNTLNDFENRLTALEEDKINCMPPTVKDKRIPKLTIKKI